MQWVITNYRSGIVDNVTLGMIHIAGYPTVGYSQLDATELCRALTAPVITSVLASVRLGSRKHAVTARVCAAMFCVLCFVQGGNWATDRLGVGVGVRVDQAALTPTPERLFRF